MAKDQAERDVNKPLNQWREQYYALVRDKTTRAEIPLCRFLLDRGGIRTVIILIVTRQVEWGDAFRKSSFNPRPRTTDQRLQGETTAMTRPYW